MATTSDIRKGFTFKMEGKIYIIVDFLHVKPGKGGAFVRTKLKNVETGAVVESTFKSGENLDEVRVEKNNYEYLYNDGAEYVFMNSETYEQIHLQKEMLSGNDLYLKENMEVMLLTLEGKVLDIELPIFVELEVTETEPGIRGNTVSGGSKPAVCETGLKINVPLFLNTGDRVKIDTRTGEYVERV